MSRPKIIINELDAERIDRLLEQPAFASLPIADALNAELDRAQMCTPQEMPHDVVSMNGDLDNAPRFLRIEVRHANVCATGVNRSTAAG
jgi:hypothetical protein